MVHCSDFLESFVIHKACSVFGDIELPLLNVLAELPVNINQTMTRYTAYENSRTYILADEPSRWCVVRTTRLRQLRYRIMCNFVACREQWNMLGIQRYFRNRSLPLAVMKWQSCDTRTLYQATAKGRVEGLISISTSLEPSGSGSYLAL